MQKFIEDYKGRITIFHVLVIGLSLTLTISVWQYSKHQVEERTMAQFEAARDRTVAVIKERMIKYEDALWAGVAAVESHDSAINYDQWHNFAQNLRIEERHRGINGIGMIHYLKEPEVRGYLAEQRRLRPDFQIFPEHDNPEKMPITFIEPETTNAAAIGLDVAHEANRRAAALMSRDTGEARITGPITLVQDSAQTAGFLFYAPFYHGSAPQTLEERRAQFAGAVYAPFVVHKLMEGLLAKDLRNLRFSIRDGDKVIYDEHVMDDPNNDAKPLLSEQLDLTMFGRVWTLDVRSDLAFRQQHSEAKPTVILIAGLMIEGLIIALLVLMARANQQAVQFADRVTADLKRESAKLAQTNQILSAQNDELEEYAYVTSHDLRTPIRGIGGLTEMLEEDLEPYLASAEANPDVGENLKRIQERVTRMHELTQGILDFSQITSLEAQSRPVDIIDLGQTLQCDFSLSDTQFCLQSDVEQIDEEPVHFRRVVENLVGNAIKYHDRKLPLKIEIVIRAKGDFCHVSVIDNGPGIDPKFHERIFAVFQTLSPPDTANSTGIGLAIVKKLVARHGGQISLSSTPGKGATFSFDWPLHKNAVVTSPNEKAA